MVADYRRHIAGVIDPSCAFVSFLDARSNCWRRGIAIRGTWKGEAGREAREARDAGRIRSFVPIRLFTSPFVDPSTATIPCVAILFRYDV